MTPQSVAVCSTPSTLARLRTCSRRLERLESMAQNPVVVDRLMAQNRYMRLAAAILMAHETVDRARLSP